MKWTALSVVVTAFAVGCTEPEGGTPVPSGWSAIPNAYAQRFELQVKGADRRLVVFGPGGRTDTAGIHRLVGDAEGRETRLPLPLQRVAVVSTTHLPFFTALEAGPAVVGVAHTEQVRDVTMRAQITNGSTAEIARTDGLDRERLIALQPQAVFDYPFGSDARSTDLEQPTIAVTEYLEEHPLGRAEWIRFFGMLLGREKKADSMFNAIEHRYMFVRDMRKHLDKAPRVLFGSHWEQNWFVPPGNSYMARLIDDAGGSYLFADSVVEGNITLALEQVLVVGEQCDHIGVVLATQGRVDAAALAGDPRVASLDAVRKGGFIGNSTTSDIFGQALLEPDVVLRDLRCIFHPRICAGHQPTYFFPIAQ